MNEVALVPEPTALAPVDVSAFLPAVQPSAGVLCPYCNARPLTNHRTPKTCGHPECKKQSDAVKQKERMHRPENIIKSRARDKNRPAEQRLKRREAHRLRMKTEAGKLWTANYRNSEKYKAKESRHASKPETILRKREYRKRPERKRYDSDYSKKYKSSEIGRSKAKLYERTPRRKLSNKKRCAKRRALIAGATIGDTNLIMKWEKSWRTKRLVRCYYCGSLAKGVDCHSDHIIPLASGGIHSIENLCISCAPCNLKKNSKNIQQWNALISQPVLI